MGIGRVDNIKPANPPVQAGHYVGICNHGSESEAEHATRLGASAGTATDIGWLLGTIKDAVCTGGTQPPVNNDCIPDRFTVATAPTGAVDGNYTKVPTTGGTGSGLVLPLVKIVGGAVELTGLLGAQGGPSYVGSYVVGDVVTVAAGKVGAGSSSFTLRIEYINCEAPV